MYSEEDTLNVLSMYLMVSRPNWRQPEGGAEWDEGFALAQGGQAAALYLARFKRADGGGTDEMREKKNNLFIYIYEIFHLFFIFI